MRYSVRYDTETRQWSVVDAFVSDKVIATHATKSAAYDHAGSQQNKWQKHGAAAQHLSRLQQILPQTLVVR